jgi:hypothetical protein
MDGLDLELYHEVHQEISEFTDQYNVNNLN